MTRRRWYIGGGLATLALASTLTLGTAFAETPATPGTSGTGSNSQVQTFIDRLAQNLGLSSDTVKQGLETTQEQFVDDAVASGKITTEQGDALKQKIESGQGGPFMFGPGFRGDHGRGVGFNGEALASAIGLTEQQLRDELSSGKTLQQVITDQGKTVGQVVDAVVQQEKTELDQAVSTGKLTQDQENQRLDALKQRLTDAINNNTLGPRPGHFGGHGPMGGGNNQAPTQAPAQSS